jgi:lysine-specific demethylase/histidyl-hydroxylase NO66
MDALEYLIHPNSTHEFLRQAWERSPLFVTERTPAYFDGLMSLEDLVDVLSRETLFYPAVQVFQAGRQLAASDYTTWWHYGRESHRLIDGDRLLDLFDRGATLNILGLERMNAQVQHLNAALERETGFPVHTTGFLTPARAANIPAHYDEVDFFVLQTYGRKRWRVWQSDTQLPLVKGGDRTYGEGHRALDAERLAGDYVLGPGDMLFVPRGLIHQTFTESAASFHITVGINPHRWYDAMKAIVDRALTSVSQDRRFRVSLPMPGSIAYEAATPATSLFAPLVQTFEQAMKESAPHAMEALDRVMLTGRYRARPGQLLELDALDTLSEESVVQRRPALVVQLTPQEDGWALRFQGKTLVVPEQYVPWLVQLEEGRSCTVGDLLALGKGERTRDGTMNAVRQLIAEGYLTHAAAARRSFAAQDPAAALSWR